MQPRLPAPAFQTGGTLSTIRSRRHETAPGTPPKAMSAPPPQRRVRLAADLTKVATSVAVAGVLLYTRNATSVLYVTGAAANSIVGKLLKKVIRQPRPTSAKSDPGMPSSHATSLAFLSLAGLGVVVRGAVFGLGQGVEIAGAVLCVVVAVVACSWRVAVGYHTVMQVVAGWMLGTVDAVVWSGVVVPWARKGVEEVLGDEGRAVTVVVGIILLGGVFLFGPDVKKALSGTQEEA